MIRLQVFMNDERGTKRVNTKLFQKRINEWFDTDSDIAPVDISAVVQSAGAQSNDSRIHAIVYDDGIAVP
jgi:hypothetical protein